MQRMLLWLVPVVSIIACDDGPASLDGSSDAVVAGVVMRASGSPVTSAVLSILVVDSARGETVLFEPDAVRTNSTGHFSTLMGGFLIAPFTGRVQITVRPPAGAQLADTTVDAGFLRFGLAPPATSNTTITYP